MINLAVFSIKDIGKYLIKIATVIILLWFFTRCTVKLKNKEFFNISLDKSKLDLILQEKIPGMKTINNEYEKEENTKQKIKLNEYILKTQLGMMYNLIKDESDDNQKDIKEKNISYNTEKAKTGLQTEVVPNNVPTNFTNSYNTVQIKNGTSYNLTEEMLKPEIEVNNKNIIIFHTHTCESYTPTEQFNYTQTGTYRTTDLNFSVARVGDELENQLKGYNYNVIHDKTYHDYPAYTGSYERSLNTVRNILANNQETDVVLDIHRDAIADYSYAPTVKIGDEYAAQLMFVIGTDGGGLEHPNWQQNLKFAVKIQEKANELYPGLFKPIILRNSRYNQHLTKAASIIEVGATGNTMEQCLTSMKYLAKVISETIK